MHKTRLYKPIILTTYLLGSILTIILNKHLIGSFISPILLTTIQCLIIVLILSFLLFFKIIKLKDKNILSYLPFSTALTLMIFTSSKSLLYLDISIFTILKNLSIIVTAFLEQFILERKISLNEYFSFILMIISSFLGEDVNIKGVFIGYIYITINILSTSIYFLMLKIFLSKNCSKVDVIFFCNLLAIPQTFLCALFMKEKFEIQLLTAKNIALIINSGIFTLLTAFSTTFCLSVFSTTTLSMLGAINKIIVSVSGIVVLGESDLNKWKIISLILGAMASLIYSREVKSI